MNIAEAERRIRRLEYIIMDMQMQLRIYSGICQNAACGYPTAHPHYVNERAIDYTTDIIYLPLEDKR